MSYIVVKLDQDYDYVMEVTYVTDFDNLEDAKRYCDNQHVEGWFDHRVVDLGDIKLCK